jgi:hypothetical protein
MYCVWDNAVGNVTTCDSNTLRLTDILSGLALGLTQPSIQQEALLATQLIIRDELLILPLYVFLALCLGTLSIIPLLLFTHLVVPHLAILLFLLFHLHFKSICIYRMCIYICISLYIPTVTDETHISDALVCSGWETGWVTATVRTVVWCTLPLVATDDIAVHSAMLGRVSALAPRVRGVNACFKRWIYPLGLVDTAAHITACVW